MFLWLLWTSIVVPPLVTTTPRCLGGEVNSCQQPQMDAIHWTEIVWEKSICWIISIIELIQYFFVSIHKMASIYSFISSKYWICINSNVIFMFMINPKYLPLQWYTRIDFIFVLWRLLLQNGEFVKVFHTLWLISYESYSYRLTSVPIPIHLSKSFFFLFW